MTRKGQLVSLSALRKYARRGIAFAVLGCVLGGTVSGHGTFHDRLAVLNERLALTPGDVSIHFRLAELYCEHEQPTEALAELATVEALGSNRLPVDYLRGVSLRMAGRANEALAALDRFVAANPAHSPAHLQRARVHAELGQIAAALADYKAALRLAARLEPDLVQESADALAKAGFSEEAVQVLDSALVQLGPVPSLTLRALDLEAASGHYDAALKRVAVIEKSTPRPEPWMAKRALLLTRAGRLAEARSAWRSLATHLARLPNLERGSHAMSLLAEQARLALEALEPSTPTTNSLSSST